MPDAMAEKAARVVSEIGRRLTRLEREWEAVSVVNVYTVHAIGGPVAEVILDGVPVTRWGGVHWHVARPPVREIEFEMDVRGVRREIRL